MANGAHKVATFQDVLDAREHKVAQVIEGVLHLVPRPSSQHARSTTKLGGQLDGPFDAGRDGPGGWFILFEPELHLGEDILVPDLAGWHRDKLPKIPRAPHITISPDWVCEVLSPATARIDRVRKMRVYVRENVAHVWLIDPDAKTLEVYRLSEAGYVLISAREESEKVRAEPFDAIELDLSVLWADVESE